MPSSVFATYGLSRFCLGLPVQTAFSGASVCERPGRTSDIDCNRVHNSLPSAALAAVFRRINFASQSELTFRVY